MTELNSRWRQRIEEIGKDAFQLEEMLRLGFITEEALEEIGAQKDALEKLVQELAPISLEIQQTNTELANLGTVEGVIAEIRRQRIERVKAERVERKAKKLAEKLERQVTWKSQNLRTPSFLGVGVSNRLKFEGGNEAALRDKGLPVLETLSDLAVITGLTNEDLIWLSYERAATDADHYSRFEIPKRTGGTRLISSPKPKMRKAQLAINNSILDKLQSSSATYAFKKSTSIVDNANQHTNSSVILKLDIKDFFPSITFPRVRGFFESLGYNPGISTVLALLCTDAPRRKVTIKGFSQVVAIGERSLPQGACTSPALSNLIASPMDLRILGWIRKSATDWKYTRYADDITFSTKNDDKHLGKLIGYINRVVREEGFEIKTQKTRIMRSPRRQTVTGLVVNQDVRIRKSELKKIRAFLHSCEKLGVPEMSHRIGKDALSVARGFVAYVQMVMPDKANEYRQKYPWLS